VLERDGLGGEGAKFKKLFRIDAADASEVQAIAALPRGALPDGVVPVKKRLFLDLLKPELGLAGPRFPRKMEGLAFGPDLPDGRHLLLVTSDNDFNKDEPTWIFALAIDARDLLGFQRQRFEK
jgi:phytase-like protein